MAASDHKRFGGAGGKDRGDESLLSAVAADGSTDVATRKAKISLVGAETQISDPEGDKAIQKLDELAKLTNQKKRVKNERAADERKAEAETAVAGTAAGSTAFASDIGLDGPSFDVNLDSSSSDSYHNPMRTPRDRSSSRESDQSTSEKSESQSVGETIDKPAVAEKGQSQIAPTLLYDNAGKVCGQFAPAPARRSPPPPAPRPRSSEQAAPNPALPKRPKQSQRSRAPNLAAYEERRRVERTQQEESDHSRSGGSHGHSEQRSGNTSRGRGINRSREQDNRSREQDNRSREQNDRRRSRSRSQRLQKVLNKTHVGLDKERSRRGPITKAGVQTAKRPAGLASECILLPNQGAGNLMVANWLVGCSVECVDLMEQLRITPFDCVVLVLTSAVAEWDRVQHWLERLAGPNDKDSSMEDVLQEKAFFKVGNRMFCCHTQGESTQLPLPYVEAPPGRWIKMCVRQLDVGPGQSAAEDGSDKHWCCGFQKPTQHGGCSSFGRLAQGE